MESLNIIGSLYQIHLITFIIMFLQKTIATDDIICNITHPIFKNGKCDSIYCTEEEYNTSKCKINNEIVKTQWLTNIVNISDINFRYITPALSKNNDLIIQTTNSTGSSERKFFGIKENGRYYFKDENNEESPYFSINVGEEGNSNYYMRQSVGGIIRILNDDNDYFLSIGGYNTSYTELIGLQTKTYSRILTKTFYVFTVFSEIATIFEMTKESANIDNKNYYIISFLSKNNNYCYLMMKIFSFNSTNIITGNTREVFKFEYCSERRKIASCFETNPSNYVICFYLGNSYEFIVIIYAGYLNLEQIFIKDIDTGMEAVENENLFLKGIHLTKNVGFFIYYKGISYTYPFVQIKEYDGSDDLKDFNSFGIIYINKYSFNSYLHLNDLIKINENQICFSSTASDKNILYIITFNFYDDYNQFVIRYYTIKLYELYNKIFLFEIKAIKFGNYLSLCCSLCSNSGCSSNNDEHISSLIIFNYPNSTDINFDLIEHLLNTNENISKININLSNYVKIENNIFGYVLKGIKLLEINEKLACTYTNMNDKYGLLNINENISISISLENQENIDIYNIKFALVLSEPNYNNINDYISFVSNQYLNEEEEIYYNPKDYIGRHSYFKIIRNHILSTNECENEECSLCYEDIKNNCISCNGEYKISEGFKICEYITSSIPISDLNTRKEYDTNINILQETFKENINNEEIKGCTKNIILNNECKEKLTSSQIEEIYGEIKNNYLYNNYNNENILIFSENAVFQLSTLEYQQYLDNQFVSSIDIGECENLLKIQEGIKPENQLIVMKTDIKDEDYEYTYVQYEIYNPDSLEKINLNICKNISIFINSPVLLSSNIESLYDSLNKSGYNLFNFNDSFYTDICSPYTSENGTDIPMSNRQNEIYNNANNKSMCQNNCTFIYLNTTSKKSKCKCEIQTNKIENDLNKINFSKQFVLSFFKTLKSANFLVLKCYKLVFSIKGQKRNIGSYIMTSLFLILIIFIVLYFILESKKIKSLINQVIKLKFGDINYVKAINKTKSNKKFKKRKKVGKKTIKKTKSKDLNRKDNKKNPPKKKNSNSISLKNNINLYNILKKKKSNSNFLNKNIKKGNNSTQKIKNIINNNVLIYNVSKNMKFPNSSLDILKPNKKKGLNLIKKKKIFNKNKGNTLNDFELNTLEYPIAIQIDKRTYIQYYLSLLKTKHLILFTFLPSNDHNLRSIKICLFLLAFSLYFTVNAFFFTDESLHNVYEYNGSFDFIFQIPQIIYSSAITSFINNFLRLFSLSERSILDLKKVKNLNKCLKSAQKVENCLKIKFIIFSIISVLFMGFFWYFISCFCAIYINTQIILIEDTIISFGLSLLYPFGINLLPGIFRIPALLNKNKDKKCLYNFSKTISII